ncbi:EAL domain-containing protein [Halomonas beimenensis]|uniref:Diguanylate cyclase/phosphodiesterase (GGDEF & EAL domains) with PAS/PAC sensor(S) n=1 Tax=Halomonas beimenensis TaxID=475662 RepID=A0A291PAZ0_9GAMM|nr:EAL domain-containing protein [Halomonas beimenensis]ATJ84064.1 diguanylate cyclase/phosphodiesterase (GGDEF & EAL domains) with PAS/PAC sensor(s) [Halomonas beimenensis]
MRAWRFSRVVLALELVLLAGVATLLLSTAYLASQEALQEGAEQAHAQHQRILDDVISAHFDSIRRYSEGLSDRDGLEQALHEGRSAAVAARVEGLLDDPQARHIDALVVESDGQAHVARSAGLLGRTLPFEALSRQPGPLANWRLMTAPGEGESQALMRLTLPIVEETLGRVVGRLHTYVVLNDSFWIANEMLRLLGARAVMLRHDGAVLDALEREPGSLRVLGAWDAKTGPVVTTPDGILQELRLPLGDGTALRMSLLLPDDSIVALRDTYTDTLLDATLVVVVVGMVLMLVLRRLTTRALDRLVAYAEAVPESGTPRRFPGGGFIEFNRVGQAFEAMLRRIRERDKYLDGISQHSPDLVFVKDLDGRYRLVNERYAWALHSTPEAMVNTPVDHVLDEEVIVQALDSDRRMVETLAPVKYHTTLHTPEGCRHYLVTKFPILDDEGRVYLIGGIATDITDLRVIQDQLQLAHRVFAETSEAIVVLDDQHRVQLANRAFAEMSGQGRSRATAVVRDFLLSHPEVAYQVERGERWQGQCEFHRHDGAGLPVLVSATPLPEDESGRHHMLLFSDITSLKVAEQRLERLAWYDALTGLANRSLFNLRLDEALQGEASARTAVIFIDLDHFKDINDTYGHSLGDELLRQVADRLRTCVQSRDTVARFGGDEFTVLLRDIADEAQALAIARRILKTLAEPYDLGVACCFTTASLGITLAARHGRSAESLLRNADQAMYEAKAQGRQQVVIFDPAIDERHQLRLRYEAGLREALTNGELFVHYQPRYDIAGERILAAEALLRWQSEAHGLVPPSTFIPIAENSSLIVELGRFVLGAACRQAAAWAAAGLEIPVSVNLSPRQLHEPDLIRDIHEATRRAGLPTRLLELEITETHLMDSIDQLLPVLHQIRAMGVGLAIDDFGTGYSSLTYLKRLPIELLKVDRSFIVDVPGDPDDEILLTAIISMAHSLGFRVVAEGVETERQRTFLERLGCDELQGFLLGRPQAADRLLAALEQDRQHSGHRA